MREMMCSVLVGAGVLAVGCGSPMQVSKTDLGGVRYERDGLAVEYMAGIDRYTFVGDAAADAPNMVKKQKLRQDPAADGSYTFYGGVYTWVSPQGGELGWIDDQGNKLDWPPDPAMDVGPTVRSAQTTYGHTTTGKVHRTGLREIKTLKMDRNRKAFFEYTLENTNAVDITAGAWVNMAIREDAVVALRMGPGTGLYGWDERSVSLLESVLDPEGAGGWRTFKIKDCDWQGGIKVYVDGAHEIAVWREGWWFYRENMERYDERLRDHGEGPVAVYLQPDSAIFEAELYGPLVDIPAYGKTTSRERWRVIESERADVGRLPR